MKSNFSITATTFPTRGLWDLRKAHATGLLPLLLLLVVPAGLQAQFNYTTNNGTITIKKYTGPGGAVTIPATITGLPVTAIGDYAFQLKAVTSVTFPDSITSIGNAAFSYCERMTSLTIPVGVTNIGYEAFSYCGSLTTVILPTSLTDIPYLAFAYCVSLTNVTIPTSVTHLGWGTFQGCTSLTHIALPTSVSYLGSGTFQDCTSLTRIALPTSVIYLGWGAFQGCTSLMDVALPSGVTSIEDSTFQGCITLTNITLGNTVTNLGSAAFSDCTSLTSVTVPAGVTSLGVSVFSSCSNLTTVTVGPSVATIGDSAFQYCAKLTGVYFEGNKPSLVGKLLFDGDNNTIVYYLAGTTGWGTTFGGRPTMLWVPQTQLSVTEVGVRTNQFGFTITGAADLVVVVEASPNLVNPNWLPVRTNTLSNGSAYFSDADWTNYPTRFYQVRSL